MNRYTDQIEAILCNTELNSITIAYLGVIKPFSVNEIRTKIRRVLGFWNTNYPNWVDLVLTFYGFLMAFNDEDFDAMVEELNSMNNAKGVI